MLDRVDVATFAALVGDTFAMDGVGVELIEAVTNPPGAPPTDDSGRRVPFTLVFRGPADPVFGQRIRALEHPDLGRLEIFFVPIGRDADGVRYEAVFT